MTVGAGLSINATEQNQQVQNRFMQQLAQGRSNAVGSFTLASNATSIDTGGASPQFGNGATLDGTTGYFSKAYAASDKFDITTGDFTVRVVCRIPATAAKCVIASKEGGVGGTW